MHFANQTDSLVHTNPMSEDGRKEICSKRAFIRCEYVVLFPSVPMLSDAYRRLCHTGSTTVHCQLTQPLYHRSQLTAVNMRHTTHRCSDVRLLRLLSVLPLSPVMTAQLDAPANINSRFRKSRCLWTSIFVFSIFPARPF